MGPCVLVAVPKGARAWVVDALRRRFELTLCSQARRARAFIAAGCFHAIVTVDGFFDDDRPLPEGVPIVRVPDEPGAEALIFQVERAVAERRASERAQAPAIAELVELSYREFAELARYRATRQYLIALVHTHQGSVTEAARASGMERESLHRLLRRHDVHADDFRQRAMQ